MSAPIDDVARQPGEWLRGEGPLRDIVISTRIRLARNISGFPFLSRATGDQRVDIGTALKSAITKAPDLRDYVHHRCHRATLVSALVSSESCALNTPDRPRRRNARWSPRCAVRVAI